MTIVLESPAVSGQPVVDADWPPPWQQNGLTRAQYEFLVSGLHKARVQMLQHKFAYLEAWDVRRTLIRAFGFAGWTLENHGLHLVKELELPASKADGPPRWTVIYRATQRLVICDQHGHPLAHWDGSAVGGAVNQPSLADAHDLAIKEAESQALKRAAINLGDQFGLCLYNDGDPAPVVRRSLVAPAEEGKADQAVDELAADETPVGRDPETAAAADPEAPLLADDVASDVAAFFAAEKTWTTADKVREQWHVAKKDGILERHAGLIDGRPVSVRERLASLAEDRMVAAAQKQAAAAQSTQPEMDVDSLPAGQGKRDCGCDSATVLKTGQHRPDCTRRARP